MVSDITSPVSSSPSAAGPTEERYWPLFALSPQAAWVYDRESLRFLEVNETAVRIYGWAREEFLAMTLRDIRPPSEQDELDEFVLNSESVVPYSVHSVHRTKGGDILRVEINSFSLDFDGRPARMALVQDVTDRERTVRALAVSEEKYRSVIEQLRDVFFRTDPDGLWSFLNQAWTMLTGNPVDSSIGTHYLAYVHPSDRVLLLDSLRPLFEGVLDSTVVEVRFFHRGGGYRWVEASAHSVRGDDSQPGGTMGTLRDVTERRAVNEERQRLATNIRQLLDASGEGIYGLDAEGVITFVNRRGSEMLGFESNELIGRQMHELTHHSHRDGTLYPSSLCPMNRAAIAGVACEVDDEVLWRRDGSQLQVGYTASPIRENGRLSGAVVLVRDNTLRKGTELELIVARDAAEAASRAKSDFLARMSHELRTPLNSIIGFANVLQKNKQATLSDEELSYLHRISTNGRHLLGLINDILDLSKIEAGRMTLDLAPVVLATLVQETIEEFGSHTRDRQVVLRSEIPPGIRSIQTDAARMKQVLINLIGNALKFTDTGEVVVSIDVSDDGNPTRITVRDTGIGIPKHRLDAIFNVFEQAESMTARRFGGTGLGLAISRSLCDLMGHHLDVESIEGKGTTMTIWLGEAPRSSRTSSPHGIPLISSSAEAGASAESESPLILVVDDDADARLLLGQLLEDTGCRVAQAASGVEALRLARELLPAMIFLDLRLPKISGFDVLRILQMDELLKGTPVIIASVVGTESRSVLSGATAILDKPISREQVLDIVRRWLPAAIR
jgi:PAS domain S-box-containing protein